MNDVFQEESIEAAAGSEADYQAEVRRNLPRNYAAHLFHGLLGQTGFRLVNAPTFLPAYVLILSGSEFVVGLARACQYLGMFLSPLLGASLIEHRKRVLGVGLTVGMLMRLQVLGLALAGLFLAPNATVVAVCIFLFLFGFFMGMQGVIFNYLMSKVIPVERRGFLMGVRNSLSGLTAATVAYLGGAYFIEPNLLGNGYAATFILAFVLTCFGLSALLLLREPEPPVVRSQVLLRDRLRELPELMRNDRAFTIYFSCRALATMGRMAVPFYILYVGDVIGTPNEAGKLIPSGSDVGVLSLTFILANSTTLFVWGLVADRIGFRVVFLFALGIWVASALGLILAASSLPGFAICFFGIGTGMGGFQMAAQNMVLEFGSREDLPMRIALANSAQEFAGFIGPLIGGTIVVFFGKQAVFITAIVMQLSAMVLVMMHVDEPRHRDA
jgi:MFS family permease